MGYILSPVAVDFSQVAATIGCKKKRLISTLVRKFGDEFEQIDEIAADFAGDEEGEGVLTVRDALTQMVMGEEYDKELGFVYGYALNFICRHLGTELPNDAWSAMPSGSAWAEKADKALKTASVPEKVLRVNRLMYRGSPVSLPEIEDFPGIGYMRVKEIEAALVSFNEDKLAAVKDKHLRASLAQVRSWLQTCAKIGRDLICFYS